MEMYKPELSSSTFGCVPGASGASSSASLTDSPIPSEMFTPNTPSIQYASPGSSSGSLAIAYPSPTGTAQTPTSKLNVGLLSSASPGKSPCPPSSARRALFPGNKNKLPLAEDLSKKLDEIDTENDDNKVAYPSNAAKEKDDKSPAPKNKRNPTAGKGAGGGKKTKQ